MSRAVRLTPLALVVACQSAGMLGAAPTPSGPTTPAIQLEMMDRFAPRGEMLAAFSDANGFTTVSMVVGMGGLGPGDCFAWMGGNCLDIVGPYRRLDATGVLSSGEGEFALDLPFNVPTGDYGIQLIDVHGVGGVESRLSNPVAVEITNQCPTDTAGTWFADAPTIDTSTNGVACDLDSDMYAIDVPANSTLTVTLDYALDLDGGLTLTVFDASELVVDGTLQPTGAETVTATNTSGTATVFYALVETWDDYGWDGVDYVLTPTVAPTP